MLPYAAVAPTTQWFTSDGLGRNQSPAGIRAEAFAIARPRARSDASTTSVDAAMLWHSAADRREKARNRSQKPRLHPANPHPATHPFPETGDRFVEHRQNQPVLEIRAAWRCSRRDFFLRLAVLPAIEALAALAAELFLLDQLDQDLRDFSLKGGAQNPADIAVKRPSRPRRSVRSVPSACRTAPRHGR